MTTEKLLRQKKDHLSFMWLLFSNSSPFQGLVHSSFKTVTFWDKYKVMKVNFEHSSLVIPADDLVGTQTQQDLVRQIFTVCGKSIRTVSCFRLDADGKDEEHLKAIANYVVDYCPNVKNLKWKPSSKHYWDACDKIVSKYAAQLRSFEWMQKTNLKRPMPDLSKCDKLTQFICRDEPNAVIIPQLQAVSSTLEEVDIGKVTGKRYGKLLEALETSCRKLSIIKMQQDIIVRAEDKYVSLLCSCGAQLKKADVQGVNQDNMRKITRACTNLEAEYALSHPFEGNWGDVDTLGPLLHRFSLSACGDEEECNQAMKGIRVLERCTNIRELIIAGDDCVRHFFTKCSDFTALESLELYYYSATEKNDALVASKTGNLKKLNCWISNDMEKESVFNRIVSTNRALRNVEINDEGSLYSRIGDRSAQNAVDIVCNVVSMFSKCHSLKLRIHQTKEKCVKESMLRDMHRKLRFSGESLKISISGRKTYS